MTGGAGVLSRGVSPLADGRVFRIVECEPSAVPVPDVGAADVPERGQYVMFADYPDVMTREQAAEALGMNVKDLGELLMAGEIRAYRDGRRWRVPKLSLFDYIERRLERGWR